MKHQKWLTAAMAGLLTLSLLTGCAGGDGGTETPSNPFGTISQNSADQNSGIITPPAATGVDAQLKVQEGEWNNIQWTSFSHMYATAEVPQGWTVEVQDLYQGGQTGSGTMISVKNPEGNVSIAYMDFATTFSSLMKEQTVESFYRDAIVSASGGTITNWVTTGTIQTESQKMFASSQSNILDARVIMADSSLNGKPMEGMYSGALDGTLAYSGMYTIVSAITMEAPKGTLANWESVLVHILSSIQWTDACKQRYQSSVLTSSSGGSTSSSDLIMEAWDNRNKSEDIMSQKRSDATLGRERVYDTTTNDIYMADSGFTEKYNSLGGQRYQPITDDMYTQGYKGYLSF